MFKHFGYDYAHWVYTVVDTKFVRRSTFGANSFSILSVYCGEDVLPNLKLYFSDFIPPNSRKREFWHLKDRAKWYPSLKTKLDPIEGCLNRYLDRLSFVGK